jgi:hypothetical protein
MADNIDKVCSILAEVDLFGAGGEPLPRLDVLSQTVEDAAPLLPHLYTATYTDPLTGGLQRLISQMGRKDPTTLETLTAAVYQHRTGSALATPLSQFIAVISDLYRSFLDKDKRANAGVPLSETLPPLAMFQHDGSNGPFTLPVDATNQLMGATVGVVSLPATYADHPFIWAALAHETGGHDVTHADAGLLDELGNGIAAAFAGMADDPSIARADLTRLWAYWIDEASADAYGLLNVGPAFAPNLAVFFAALNAKITGTPGLRMESGFSQDDPDQILDPHPTDIIRLHLAIGVIESLSGLAAAVRAQYVKQIGDLAARFATGDSVTIAGNIPDNNNQLQPLQAKVPLAVMQQAARRVGGYIASARLNALGAHSIQDIETWDDPDEASAQTVKAAFAAAQPVDRLGDDAQLLAGATMALLDNPDQYKSITDSLMHGLNHSFQTDPIWGVAPVDAAYIRYAEHLVLSPRWRRR